MALTFRGNNREIDQHVDLLIEATEWKMRDSDNSVKAILDALQLGGVVNNDRLIRDYAVRRLYHKRDEKDHLNLWLVTTEDDSVARAFEEGML
jgi:Holliday junction resolvase RusA-like endonuclease